jgi:TonB-dependent SusC/RagA subfamily outer membrane receptor
MKNPYFVYLAIFFSFIFSFGFITEEDPLKVFLSKLAEYNEKTMREKVHIHFDKPYYAVGDTIWFKTYVVNFENNQLSNRSKIVYVELLNEKDSLKKSLRLPMAAGVASGDFVLPESYTEGNYRVRAYTAWMRNFDEGFFFDKTIKIGNSLTNKVLTYAKFGFSKTGIKENVDANLTYTDFKGEPFKGKDVSYTIQLDNRNVLSGKGVTDNRGNLKIQFTNSQPFILKSGHINTFIKVDSLTTIKKVFPVKATSNDVNVQFFPESGSMVNGIRSRVGFKVVGADGLGKKATGVVVNSSTEKVAEFNSEYAGMGTFSLTPVEGQVYTAKVKFDDGSEKVFELPRAQSSGYILTVNNENENNLVIKINTSANVATGEEVTVIGQSNGEVHYISKSRISGGPLFASVPKKQFPRGILQLTLFNSSYHPLAERLVFIRRQPSSNLTAFPDKEAYNTRSLVKMNLLTVDSTGKPLRGLFSIAVTNELSIPFDDVNENTIESNLLLSSEIKGHIETSNYYFTNPNQQKDKALDNLMLTQGWRTFDWKSVNAGIIPSFVYQPERSISITGIVTEALGRPSVGSKVTLMSSAGTTVILDTITSAQGRFNFSNLLFNDSTSFVVQAKNSKGKSNVTITVDRDNPQVITKNLNAANVEVNVNQSLIPYLTYRADQFNEMRKKGLLRREIMLSEVKVVTAKKKIQHSSNLNGAGNADATLTADNFGNCPDLASCLEGRIAGLIIQNGKAYLARNMNSSLSGQTAMQLVVDGMYLEPDYLSMISIYDVESIEVLKNISNTAIYGLRGGGGVLIINTRRGQNRSNVMSKGIASYSPQGYYLSRQFYSPKYDVSEVNKAADLRSTIFWAPNVITDSNGKASIEFYTADKPGSYKAVIEGIDLNGSVTRQVHRFKVN